MSASKKTLQDTMNINNFGACFFSFSFNHLPHVVSFKKQNEYQGIYIIKYYTLPFHTIFGSKHSLVECDLCTPQFTREGQPGGKTRQILQEIEATVK